MNAPYPNQPLSNIQAQYVEDRLLKSLDVKHAMGFAMFDGYATGLVCSPNPIDPSVWMPWIWDTHKGSDIARFASQEDMDVLLGLLMQHQRAVTECLANRPGHFYPAVNRTIHLKGSSFAGHAWCTGYQLAMSLDDAAWQPILKAEPQLLDRILRKDAEVPNLIARDATLVYAWWQTRRTIVTPSSRNELCPCGSGKRFKSCHGSIA